MSNIIESEILTQPCASVSIWGNLWSIHAIDGQRLKVLFVEDDAIARGCIGPRLSEIAGIKRKIHYYPGKISGTSFNQACYDCRLELVCWYLFFVFQLCLLLSETGGLKNPGGLVEVLLGDAHYLVHNHSSVEIVNFYTSLEQMILISNDSSVLTSLAGVIVTRSSGGVNNTSLDRIEINFLSKVTFKDPVRTQRMRSKNAAKDNFPEN